MKAAVLYELGKPLVMEDGIAIPPLHRGQALVKLAYSGVCHSQLMEARGKRGNDPYLPHLLGHEGTGKVIETGPGVTKLRAGDNVVLGWIKGAGVEAGGCQYRLGSSLINSGAVTTFSDYTVVSENRCVKLPTGFPLDIGVLFGCAIPTGAGIMINTLKPAPDSSISIFGLGGIGLSALIAARLYRPRVVVAVDINQDKLDLAARLGATHLVNGSREDPVAAIHRITNSTGVDYSVEAGGRTDTIEQAFRSVRKNGGRCVFASHPAAGEVVRLDPFDLISGKRIEGSWGGEVYPDRDVPRLVERYLAGDLPLDAFLSRGYTLDSINQALDDLEGHRVVRALVAIDPELR